MSNTPCQVLHGFYKDVFRSIKAASFDGGVVWWGVVVAQDPHLREGKRKKQIRRELGEKKREGSGRNGHVDLSAKAGRKG